MIYRVIVKISYNEAFFDFDNAAEACALATMLLEHMVDSEDSKRHKSIRMEIINLNVEEEEED